jgi:hypothetical protein
MAREPARQKKSYGGCTVDHFSPQKNEDWPSAINVVLGFEEAMKLHLALQDRLLAMNRMNRSTREGKAAAVNLCIHTDISSITVNAGKLGRRRQQGE